MTFTWKFPLCAVGVVDQDEAKLFDVQTHQGKQYLPIFQNPNEAAKFAESKNLGNVFAIESKSDCLKFFLELKKQKVPAIGFMKSPEWYPFMCLDIDGAIENVRALPDEEE
jgi:hypothetical protein